MPAQESRPSSPSAAGGGSIKQQRAAARQAKLDKYRKEQARRVRNRRIGIAGAIVGGLAIVALLVVSFVLAPRAASYNAGSEGADVPGVESYQNETTHVDTAVDYEQTPPVGGAHNPVWLNCGVYGSPVPNENAVHSLEHGAVWITYDPARVSDEDVTALRALLPSRHAILSPYEGMDSLIAVTAWNKQLKLDGVDEDGIKAFIEEYWLSEDAPEPGAPCTGGADGADKIS